MRFSSFVIVSLVALSAHTAAAQIAPSSISPDSLGFSSSAQVDTAGTGVSNRNGSFNATSIAEVDVFATPNGEETLGKLESGMSVAVYDVVGDRAAVTSEVGSYLGWVPVSALQHADGGQVTRQDPSGLALADELVSLQRRATIAAEQTASSARSTRTHTAILMWIIVAGVSLIVLGALGSVISSSSRR